MGRDGARDGMVCVDGVRALDGMGNEISYFLTYGLEQSVRILIEQFARTMFEQFESRKLQEM